MKFARLGSMYLSTVSYSLVFNIYVFRTLLRWAQYKYKTKTMPIRFKQLPFDLEETQPSVVDLNPNLERKYTSRAAYFCFFYIVF